MPLYDFECPVCGPFEHFLPLSEWSDTVVHDCEGWYGGCISKMMITYPGIKPLENCRGQSYHPITGERLKSQGFYNHFVTGPQGDGYFSDRNHYDKWMKKNDMCEY
jgi:putative FmdB family regulatory protein|tara:strand:- start:161 stop:478 length:318 start_codon:yes stop_codon:yes gene_type:complete